VRAAHCGTVVLYRTTRVSSPTAHRSGKIGGGRHHETEFPEAAAVVRQVRLHIDELRSRNMTVLKILAAGSDRIGSFRIRDQVRRAIEHDKTGVIEMHLQPFGFGEKFRMSNKAIGCGAHTHLSLRGSF